MPICGLCGKKCEIECPNCRYPDHLVEKKFDKHEGKAPTKERMGTTVGDRNAAYVWPKFKRGTKPPVPPDADRA